MNRRLQMILGIALVAALGALFWVAGAVKKNSLASKKISTQQIVAAKNHVKAGEVLTSDDLTMMDYPGTVPQGAVQNKQALVGRGAIADLYPGAPILEMQLAPQGQGGGLSTVIPSGMRAVAVKVDEVVGLSGFVTPGQRVDVLVMGKMPEDKPQTADTNTQVRTILQNLQVLSAGTNMQHDAQGKPQVVQVVNLLVTPDQAQMLSLAGNQAHVQLTLRNPLDSQKVDVTGGDLATLYGGKLVKKSTGTTFSAVARRPASHQHEATDPSHFHVVEVFNGTTSSIVKFPA